MKIYFLCFFLAFSYAHAQSFQPPDISGLELWLTGDSVHKSMNNFVDTIYDLSNKENHAVQTNAAFRPEVVEDNLLLNHHSSIKFDGVDDYMEFLQINTIRSAFFVVKHATGNQLGAPILGDPAYYDFFAGISTVFGGSANAKIVNGLSFSNGDSIPPLILTRPTEYSILSIITTGNVVASFITNDRNTSGRYWDGEYVEIIIYSTLLNKSERQSVEQYLFDKYSRPVNLGIDTVLVNSFCNIKLNAGDGYKSYLWSNGSSTQNISVDSSGQYFVTATNIFGKVSSDTINVVIKRPPYVRQKDTLLCGDKYVWAINLNRSDYTFLWQDNTTDSLFTAIQSGVYSIEIKDKYGCLYTDTANIVLDKFSRTTSLGTDTSICSGNYLSLLTGFEQATSYLWSTGATTSSIAITTTGTYSVTVKNSMGCTARDTVNINIKGVAPSVGFLSPAVCFGVPFIFTDTSKTSLPDKVSSWQWNFGDGTGINTQQNPIHSYTAAGTYAVSLNVQSDSGCVATANKVVTILPKPNANFSFDLSCSGVVTQLYDQSSVSNSTIAQWAWNFGEASSSNNTSTLKNPQHTYSLSGTYTATLISTAANSCADTVWNTVPVNQSPKSSFASSKVCKGNPTAFQNTSLGNINTWQWNFGDFTSLSPLQNPSHLYSLPGTYSVTLFVKDMNGCSNITVDSVMVYHNPVAKVSPDSVCVNTVAVLQDKSTVTGSTVNAWNWNLFALGTSTVQNPTVTYTNTGTHTITLTIVSAQTCTATVSKLISVVSSPSASFSFNPTFGAPPFTVLFNSSTSSSDTYSYLWNFGTGSQSVASNPSYTYNDTGLYVITFVAATKFGCKDSVKDTLRVAIPKLDAAVKTINTITSNTIKVSALLYNAGTLDIYSIELVAYLDNGTRVHEVWNGKLKAYSFATYQFNSSFENLGNKHSIICVEIEKVNFQEDDVVSNNQSCTPVSNEFTLLDPFPNPAENEIYFLFTLPKVNHIKAQVFDATGKLVEVLSDGEMSQGLNTISYNTILLRKGIYLLKFEYGTEKTEIKKFLKK